MDSASETCGTSEQWKKKREREKIHTLTISGIREVHHHRSTQRIIRDEMDKLLKVHKLLKLTQKAKNFVYELIMMSMCYWRWVIGSWGFIMLFSLLFYRF